MPRYIVITPVRDEEQHLENTIHSMLRQTIRPVQWVLVNDGSTDKTPTIIDHWKSQEPWITAVHRPNAVQKSACITLPAPESDPFCRGVRALQAKEIEAFYHGFERLRYSDWDFLVKLDGDVSFDRDYFEKCLGLFDSEPNLGIGGG